MAVWTCGRSGSKKHFALILMTMALVVLTIPEKLLLVLAK